MNQIPVTGTQLPPSPHVHLIDLTTRYRPESLKLDKALVVFPRLLHGINLEEDVNPSLPHYGVRHPRGYNNHPRSIQR